VSAVTDNDWQATGGRASRPVAPETVARPWAEKLVALRDTLIVFSMQLVFRVTMFLRHLNY
jgi:hypothetical protein